MQGNIWPPPLYTNGTRTFLRIIMQLRSFQRLLAPSWAGYQSPPRKQSPSGLCVNQAQCVCLLNLPVSKPCSLHAGKGWFSSGSRGPWGPGSPCPQDVFNIMQFSGNFKGNVVWGIASLLSKEQGLKVQVSVVYCSSDIRCAQDTKALVSRVMLCF